MRVRFDLIFVCWYGLSALNIICYKICMMFRWIGYVLFCDVLVFAFA